jgi:hypothetical protein
MGINESQPRSQTSAVAPTDQVRAHELTEAGLVPINKLADGGQAGTSPAILGGTTQALMTDVIGRNQWASAEQVVIGI